MYRALILLENVPAVESLAPIVLGKKRQEPVLVRYQLPQHQLPQHQLPQHQL